MILLRQKLYSKTSKMIKGALILAPVGTLLGARAAVKNGNDKVPIEEKREAAKRIIEENEKQIKANKKAYPLYKERARIEREKLGPKENWDDLDRTEIEMADDIWKDIPRENKELREENKALKSGDYSSILLKDTDTGADYLAKGAGIGTLAGLGTGALAGYGLHKLAKKLKK